MFHIVMLWQLYVIKILEQYVSDNYSDIFPIIKKNNMLHLLNRIIQIYLKYVCFSMFDLCRECVLEQLPFILYHIVKFAFHIVPDLVFYEHIIQISNITAVIS